MAVAALARDLHGDPTIPGVLRFTGLFVLVWWAWMGFTWCATAFDNGDVVYRVALFATMLGILSVAADTDDVANGASSGFVISYAALRLLLVGLYFRAHRHETTARDFTTRYAVDKENIRHLADEELAEKRRAAEDARGERFRAMQDDLGFRVTAHPDGTLEIGWKFGGAPSCCVWGTTRATIATPRSTS